ncbi:MAG: GumC family protein [Terriglobia bacterium]
MPEKNEIIVKAPNAIEMGYVPSTRSSPNAVRDLFSVFFRNRRLVQITFLSTLCGAVAYVLLFGIKYESTTQILVKHRRADEVVSTDANSREETNSTDVPTEREINTEISLLRGGDLMAQVVKDTGLDTRENHPWNKLIPGRDESWRVARAADKLRADLRITEIPQSNMIEVAYRSRNPQMTERVLSDLDRLYLAKHLAVYRPPGEYGFFQHQAEHYQTELDQAEQQLASYDLSKGASDPDLDKEILLRKAGEFDGSLRETQADISQTAKRIGELQELLQKTPDRLTTQVTSGDNPQLMALLKSSLADLETKRTDLLTKYQPTYRLVKESDKQIADLKTAIAAESEKPVRQESTGENPTYELLKGELVKANEDLMGYTAKARATAPVVDTYRQQALLMDQKGIQRQDLVRNIKAAEENYMLYVQKQEQARISDELDKSRILNVAIAEAPSIPGLPVFSPWLLLLAGGVLALMISTAVAFFADYLDPSFRTPDEVSQFLGLPLLACFPKDGYPPRFGLLTARGEMAEAARGSSEPLADGDGPPLANLGGGGPGRFFGFGGKGR